MPEHAGPEAHGGTVRSVFEVDCSAVIPQCGYRCSECVDEMSRVFEGTRGVTAFYTEGEGEEGKIVIEHDSVKAPAKGLAEALEQLPSHHPGTFKVTSVVTRAL